MAELAGRLGIALSKDLPGAEAQYRMAPVNRGRQGVPADAKTGAVLLLICEDSEGAFIPLIVRREYAGAHSAQVSLPGGKAEPGDASMSYTALRECGEEIGITGTETIGQLTELYIPVSRFVVHPFVAVHDEFDPLMIPHEREVERIIRLRLDVIKDAQGIVRNGPVTAGNTTITAPWYDVEGHQVWGATAMILSEFSEILQRAL